MYWVWAEGDVVSYKSGAALLGGWVTALYDGKGTKLAARTFDNLDRARRWGRGMCRKGSK